MPKKKYNPKMAVKAAAANTLNLSVTPQYSGGINPVPIAPINILSRLIAAKIAMDRNFFSRYPLS